MTRAPAAPKGDPVARNLRAPLSLTGKRWLLRDCDEAARDALAARLGCSPILARLLANRGLSTGDQARNFLAPDLHDLHEPDLLPDVGKAVERVRAALGAGERVLVYGDYDADGVTATALLLRFLSQIGLEARHHIPNRVEEGYGVHREAIERAAAEGVGLIITVDCGVTAVEEVARARELGIDVVVTDHHEPGRELPRAVAVVDPKLTGSLYPFRELAGVGVAFKLAWAIAQSFSPGKRVTPEFRAFLLDAMGLVAIGTVADVVPLTGENRVFAAFGLHALRQSTSPGITALVEQAGVRDRRLKPRDIAFKIAPRLNAAGRVAHADLCVDLFTSRSLPEAEAIARELETKNAERRRIQADILASARERLAEPGWEDARSIVLAHEDWHPGVVGIVASRLAEEHSRPVVLLGIRNGLARGSARSVPSFNLYEAIDACAPVLLAYGGHAQAAGLTLDRGNIDRFRELFEQQARRHLGAEPCGLLEIDGEIALAALGPNLVRELERLAPFGHGNPPPVFAASSVALAGQARRMGGQGQHLAFYVRQGDVSLRAIGFGMGHLYETMTEGDVGLDIAFQPKIDDYRGVEAVELQLCDVRLRPRPPAG